MRMVAVKFKGHTYRIPEMWLVGRQQAGRTYREAVGDWIEQENLSLENAGVPNAPISVEQASKIANEIWGGVYLVRRVQGGFEVLLHSATGPRHLLDEHGNEVRRNAGVPEEGPQEHIRNALASISAERQLLERGAPVDSSQELHTWLGQVEARLRTALQQLKDRRVNIPLPRGANRRSVRRGNPMLAVLGNPRVVDATLAEWAKIEYRRPDDPDGKRVTRVHEFTDGFEIGWLSDGSVQLSHPKHPLWTEDGER